MRRASVAALSLAAGVAVAACATSGPSPGGGAARPPSATNTAPSATGTPIERSSSSSSPNPGDPATSSPYVPYRVRGWISTENAKTGTDDWRMVPRHLLIPDTIDGYADTTSARIGDTFGLYVSSTYSPSFNVQAFRMGYYGGKQGRLVWTSDQIPVSKQPRAKIAQKTHTAEALWDLSTSILIGPDWAPGTYLLKLTSSAGAQSYVPLTIRDDASTADLVAIDAVTTWQAYNDWGGCSLYQCLISHEAARAPVVSFNRPIFGFYNHGSADYLDHELPLIALTEELGLDVTYVTDIDLHERPSLVLAHHGVLSLGHDEYYSTQMYDALVSAREHGVNLAFFGANAVYRRIRLEPDAQGRPDRLIVNYRGSFDPASLVDHQDVTTDWRNTPLSRPEESLIGIMYECASPGDMRVVNSKSWIWEGTGVRDGTVLRRLVGSEYDRVYRTKDAPKNLEVLSNSLVYCRGLPSYANSSYYSAPSGAGVFATGTIDWICALGALCTKAPVPAVVRQATINVLEAFATGPAGLAHPSKPNASRVIVSPPLPAGAGSESATPSASATAPGQTTVPSASSSTTLKPHGPTSTGSSVPSSSSSQPAKPPPTTTTHSSTTGHSSTS